MTDNVQRRSTYPKNKFIQNVAALPPPHVFNGEGKSAIKFIFVEFAADVQIIYVKK